MSLREVHVSFGRVYVSIFCQLCNNVSPKDKIQTKKKYVGRNKQKKLRTELILKVNMNDEKYTFALKL